MQEHSFSHRAPSHTYTVSRLDAPGFICYLEATGEITEAAAHAATLAGFFIDVSYEWIAIKFHGLWRGWKMACCQNRRRLWQISTA